VNGPSFFRGLLLYYTDMHLPGVCLCWPIETGMLFYCFILFPPSVAVISTYIKECAYAA
jgi:hypothetical protein